MTHANISIFVPHLGCPNQCSFCNQKHITSTSLSPDAKSVEEAVQLAKNSTKYNPSSTEIAFFGGSFTAIEREYMLTLLKSAKAFVDSGDVKGIRVSTRPDCIDDEILEILKEHKVTAIELGTQSLSDDVLNLNKRGHTAIDVENAVNLIKKWGFELGLQMMTGLYGDSAEKSVLTAKKIIELKPDTVRIYPTIVLKNTELEKLYLEGKYKPQELSKAVTLCNRLRNMFEDVGIRVIRVGLHSIDESSYVSGPWHPAFSELCESERYLELMLSTLRETGEYNVYVSTTELSKAIGHKKSNIKKLADLGYKINVFSKQNLDKYQLIVSKI